MRYLLPFLLLTGCASQAHYPVATGPNCFSLDPAYYRTLTDDELSQCAAVPPSGGYVTYQPQPQPQLPNTIVIFGPYGSSTTLSCTGSSCQTLR